MLQKLYEKRGGENLNLMKLPYLIQSHAHKGAYFAAELKKFNQKKKSGKIL